MKKLLQIGLSSSIIVASLAFALPAFAGTPTVSVNPNTNPLTININNADSNASITLYYRQSSSAWSSVNNWGQTDSTGSHTDNLPVSYDGSNNPMMIYVVVNGTQSSIVQVDPISGSVCSVACSTSTSSSSLLAQTSLTLNPGQSTVINTTPTGSIYVSSNTNTSVSNFSINGTQLTVYGLSAGTNVMTVCDNANNNCSQLTVTVQSGSTSTGTISLSTNNVSMNSGQTNSVSASGYNGTLFVSGNSNINAVSAAVNGSAITLYAIATGSSTINVCQTGSAGCVLLYVSVNGAATANNGVVTFSTTNPAMSVGQGEAVSLYSSNSYAGTYQVSSNSNASVVSAGIGSASLYLVANSVGSATLNICQLNTSNCGSLVVTVNTASTSTTTANNSLYFATTSMPAGTAGQYYSQPLQALDGVTPYNYTLSSGNFPPGINMTNTGDIYGTPTSTGNYNFIINVTDASNNSGSATIAMIVNGTPTVLGASTTQYPSGELINENGTISIVYQNTKIGFANAAAFTGLGFKFSNVNIISNSGLIQSSVVVNTASAAHPWGSWVKNGNTIYFVQQSGLIPVADWNTFLNNGGQSSYIVTANNYDLALPVLAVMSIGDTRVQ